MNPPGQGAPYLAFSEPADPVAAHLADDLADEVVLQSQVGDHGVRAQRAGEETTASTFEAAIFAHAAAVGTTGPAFDDDCPETTAVRVAAERQCAGVPATTGSVQTCRLTCRATLKVPNRPDTSTSLARSTSRRVGPSSVTDRIATW